MQVTSSSNARTRRRLLDRQQASDPDVTRRVARIVAGVRRRGDAALGDYVRRLDGWSGPLEVPPDEIRRAAASVPPAVRRAIKAAARHIRRIAKRQVPQGWKVSTAPGVVVEQRVTPLGRVGCYVPGGRYPLPSSLLMTAIPARVAGVTEVVAEIGRAHV